MNLEWKFEPGHTSATFCVRHMMVCNVRGAFKNITGSMTFDPENPSGGSVEATIDASTLWTGEPDRDDHLKHDDFLGVEDYPEISYSGDRVSSTGENQLDVHGDLTIRDVTKEVVLDVEYFGKWSTPYWVGDENKGPIDRIGFEAQTTINRHDFNVSWNSSLDNGGVVVGDDVKITIDAEALEADTI